METNRLLRATACDCLKELELAIPVRLVNIVVLNLMCLHVVEVL